MKVYCLVLVLSMIFVVSGQPNELNDTNSTCINVSSSMASNQPQELDKTSIPVQYSDILDLDFLVLEIDEDTMARFGVGKLEAASHEMYKISITNNGDIRISNVTVFDQMDKDTNFESTRYYEENLGRLDVTRDPCDFKEETKTSLTWDIGTLEPEEIKSILLEAYIRPEVNNTNVRVHVRGEVVEDSLVSVVSASKDKANVTDCEYLDKITDTKCYELSDTCQVVGCPDWSIPQ